MNRDREGFPFWRTAAAVMVGNLMAAMVIWFAMTAWAGYAGKQMAEALRAQTERMQAESTRRQQETASRRADEHLAAEARRDEREGPYMRSATSRIPTGELACLSGRVARREANGWQQQFDGNGLTIKCRTSR